MAINTKIILRAAAVLALSGACASTFAQSTEYRRGYADGFAAGQRAGRDGGGRPDWSRARIDEAIYGAHGAGCDARRGVYDSMERNGGAIRVSNELCGDPAPGQPKRLRIIYRCGDTDPLRLVANEGETMRLSCRR